MNRDINTISSAPDSTNTAEEEEKVHEGSSEGRARPKVKSLKPLPDTEAYEPWYETITYGYAWIGGFRPYLFWANTTNCFHRMSNMTYHEIPDFQKQIARPRLSVYEGMEQTTFFIRNITQHLWYCTSAFTTASRYWEARVAEYNYVAIDFFLSMLQNVLA